MERVFRIKAWLRYQLKAHYRGGHHVHSPYTYHLFTNVLFERWPYYSFAKIESIRRKMKLKESAADGAKYTQLLQRLCATNHAESIIEIGRTSGISTMYLAANDSRSRVYSISDGMPSELFKTAGYRNIRQEKIKVLEGILEHEEHVDMLLVKSGIRGIDSIFERFSSKSREGSIFIFEGIHSDEEREKEWKRIQAADGITLSMDLYNIGIVWFRSELKRQHYTVKY